MQIMYIVYGMQGVFSIGYNILWCEYKVSGGSHTPVHKHLSWFSSQSPFGPYNIKFNGWFYIHLLLNSVRKNDGDSL